MLTCEKGLTCFVPESADSSGEFAHYISTGEY